MTEVNNYCCGQQVLLSRRYLVNNELVSASVRRFGTFGLLTAEPCLPDEHCDDAGKHKYCVFQEAY